MRTEDLFAWIKERHAVYTRKAAGLPKPWTQDPILQKFRFCNVYRELDTVTQWIAGHWRDPHTTNPDVWFAMAVARLVNWPDALQEICFPVPWNALAFAEALEFRKRGGRKAFTATYITPAPRAGSDYDGSKAWYIAGELLNPLWAGREVIRPHDGDTLASFYDRLRKIKGIGGFMAGQIVCDTKYTETLKDANDWWTWATPGPGSRRGLARVFDKPVTYNWKDAEWKTHLDTLRTDISLMAYDADLPPIHAQDLQNCLCEFDKYERVRLGEGRPRNNYPGT